MERLTHDVDFGLEDWEETLFFVKSDPNGAYNILDIARFQGEAEFDEILKNIALRLAAYEDTGLTPAEVQVMRWIPVEERLPEEEGVYIVCVDGEVKWDAYCMFEGVERWLCYDGRLNALYIDPYSSKLTREPPYPRVTHWMPLPPSPPAKGEK